MHAGLKGKRRADVVNFFQGQSSVRNEYVAEPIPDILVSTGYLIGTGWNLTRASKLVMMEPEWLQMVEEQAGKRINRIGATVPTTQYLLICPNSQIEDIIHDRQKRRAAITEMALKGRDIPKEDLEGSDGEE